MYPFWSWYVMVPCFLVLHFVLIGAVVAIKKKRGDFDIDDDE